METSFQAWKYAKGLYLIPLFMVYNEALILGGPLPLVIWTGFIAIVALVGFAAMLEGFLFAPMAMWQRVALLPAVVAVFWPAFWIEAAGVVAIVAILAMNRATVSRAAAVT